LECEDRMRVPRLQTPLIALIRGVTGTAREYAALRSSSGLKVDVAVDEGLAER
jgi:hypothetical protein